MPVYTMQELVRETGYKAQTIRMYASIGLIPHANRRGRGATWSPTALKILQSFKSTIHPGNRETRAGLAERAGFDPKVLP